MPVYNIYSKRQKALRDADNDVYSYESAPRRLRQQICFILDGLYNQAHYPDADALYKDVQHMLSREYGREGLRFSGEVIHEGRAIKDAIMDGVIDVEYLRGIEDLLDITEACMCLYENIIDRDVYDESVSELNYRFKDNDVGYQFIDGLIVKMDSELIHREMVVPCIALLRDPIFEGPNDEYLKAHGHYRHGNNKEAIVYALAAFESTLKVIIKRRGWDYSEKFTASKLLSVVFENELIPSYLQTQYTSLNSVLESGVPTIRNKKAGHGQGDAVVVVPDHFAAFQLHLTASAILFLVESDRALGD